jgi:hypothetical protein
VLAAALYGFAIGSVHSVRLASWNLWKFPLLILATSALCAWAYYTFAQFATRRLSFADVTRVSLGTYRDAALLLASLSPVAFFLARTVVQPSAYRLGEYPLFLGLNVCFIALCGSVALVRQSLTLLRKHGLAWRTSVQIVVPWLALSLFAGGQCAWFLRPFFGPSMIQDPRVIEGWGTDYRGAGNFYEAIYHLIQAPPLPERWFERRCP